MSDMSDDLTSNPEHLLEIEAAIRHSGDPDDTEYEYASEDSVPTTDSDSNNDSNDEDDDKVSTQQADLNTEKESSANTADSSVLLQHHYNPDATPSKLTIALGLWAHSIGLSRHDFAGLRQIFQLVDHPNINSIPHSLSTLNRHFLKNIPLLDMRMKKIPLNPKKMPTEAESRKAASTTDSAPMEDVYWFDPESLFAAFLRSDIAKGMHMGMAEYHDTPTELWHSRCWSSSVRTSSGQYAHFWSGEAIFPSDFLCFVCDDTDCACHNETGDTYHLGRVYGVGLDFRSQPVVPDHGIVLEIQLAFMAQDLGDREVEGLLLNEVVLSVEDLVMIPERNARYQVHVALDYTYGEDISKIGVQNAFEVDEKTLFVRRMFTDMDDVVLEFRPLCHTHPLRGELELAEFGRDCFVEQWDVTRNGNTTMSVPLLTFIDGFGLYRNMYRSLMGKLRLQF